MRSLVPHTQKSQWFLFIVLIVGIAWFFQDIAAPGASHLIETGTADQIAMEDDLTQIDEFLVDWDRFAQGDNELVPKIQQTEAGFESALARRLTHGDTRAPARLVFYAVVQIGGFIARESELGRAAKSVLGEDFPIATSDDGEDLFFAGDLYYWWQDNKENFAAYSLLEEWQQRDFTVSTVIPMYENLRSSE